MADSPADLADGEIPQHLKPFASFLQQHEHGGLHNELSEDLAELTRAVVDNQKAGTLTLTLKLKPTKMDGALEVEASVKVKTPEVERPTAFWFPDAHGNLHRRDPRQMQFSDAPVREVPVPTAATREVSAVPATPREVIG